MGQEGGCLEIKRTRTSAQPGRRHLEHRRHLGWEDKIPLVTAGAAGRGLPMRQAAVCDSAVELRPEGRSEGVSLLSTGPPSPRHLGWILNDVHVSLGRSKSDC